MNVQEITIDNQVLPIAFNMKALFAFSTVSGVSLDQLNDLMSQDIAVLEELFYQGLKEGHRIKGQELAIAKADVLAVTPSEFQQYTTALELAMATAPAKKKSGKNKMKA